MSMDSMSGLGSAAASMAKDSLGAQLITKTIDKLNPGSSLSSGQVTADQDFQRAVLSAAFATQGKGTKLDVVA